MELINILAQNVLHASSSERHTHALEWKAFNIQQRSALSVMPFRRCAHNMNMLKIFKLVEIFWLVPGCLRQTQIFLSNMLWQMYCKWGKLENFDFDVRICYTKLFRIRILKHLFSVLVSKRYSKNAISTIDFRLKRVTNHWNISGINSSPPITNFVFVPNPCQIQLKHCITASDFPTFS